ncbi:hypothetical protein [Klebsiella pneumoniae]|uniref:hypothetical protein n=1 Tax=Klebsiella pneumoniae TaxID=573 RepID=UPI0032C1E8A5
MFAGKKSAQIREILISESAWEEMTCLFAPSLAEQPLRLEITMINDKGERKTYNVENNGKIITPMNY